MRLMMTEPLRALLEDAVYNGSTIAEHILRDDTVTTAKLNYLDYKRGMLTYLPTGRDHVVNDDGSWAVIGRQAGKPARVIRRILRYPDDYSDGCYEQFAATITATELVEAGTFTVVRGDDIAETYREADGCGLGSCMTHATEYLGLYVDNPDQIGLLTCRNVHDNLAARALLWTLDDGPMLLDRVYGGLVASRAMRAHADTQQWYYRESDGWSSSLSRRDANGHHVAFAWSAVRVTLPYHRQAVYPFLDTLNHYYPTHDLLAATPHTGYGRHYVLTSTTGGPTDIHTCARCETFLLYETDGRRYDGDDDNDGTYCHDCYRVRFPACDGCYLEIPVYTLHEIGSARYCYTCYLERTVCCQHCAARDTSDRLILDAAGYCQRCASRVASYALRPAVTVSFAGTEERNER